MRIVHRLAQDIAAHRNNVGEKPAIVRVDDTLRPATAGGAAATAAAADDDVVVEEFSFETTAHRIRDYLPEESRTAYFSLVAPRGWRTRRRGWSFAYSAAVAVSAEAATRRLSALVATR